MLRDIRELDVPEDFRQSNFGLASYLDEQGKPRPMVEISRDGFTFLVMGFTGKEAARFKLAYIKAFNKMEETLRHISASASAATDMASIPRFQLDRLKDRVISLQEAEIARLTAPKRGHRRGISITNQIGAQLYDLLAEGKSQREMSLITGINQTRICHFLQDQPALPFKR